MTSKIYALQEKNQKIFYYCIDQRKESKFLFGKFKPTIFVLLHIVHTIMHCISKQQQKILIFF